MGGLVSDRPWTPLAYPTPRWASSVSRLLSLRSRCIQEVSMRTLVFVFFATPAFVVLLLSCNSDAPLEPAAVTDLRLAAAASGTQLPAPTSATAVPSSESQIDITWQDGSSNETKFEVHRSTTGESGVFTLLATTGPNLVAYRDRGLEP